jgi:hypothetical protein
LAKADKLVIANCWSSQCKALENAKDTKVQNAKHLEFCRFVKFGISNAERWHCDRAVPIKSLPAGRQALQDSIG